MKVLTVIFGLFALVGCVIAFIDHDSLLLVSSFTLALSMGFQFEYYKTRKPRYMTVSMILICINTALSIYRMFSEKGFPHA